jgi:hypothetical protein
MAERGYVNSHQCTGSIVSTWLVSFNKATKELVLHCGCTRLDGRDRECKRGRSRVLPLSLYLSITMYSSKYKYCSVLVEQKHGLAEFQYPNVSSTAICLRRLYSLAHAV